MNTDLRSGQVWLVKHLCTYFEILFISYYFLFILQEHLCRANVLAPVILRLEDFGHTLKFDCVQSVVEYVYRGEVLIQVCSLFSCLSVFSR